MTEQAELRTTGTSREPAASGWATGLIALAGQTWIGLLGIALVPPRTGRFVGALR